MDIIISFLLTLIGGLIGVLVGVFLGDYLSRRRIREQTLRALVQELRDNASLMVTYLDTWVKAGKIRPLFYPYMDAYLAARSMGVLVTLNAELRNELTAIYNHLRTINEDAIAINLGLKEARNPEELKLSWPELAKSAFDVASKIEKIL